jgi:DNA-3-methyladenine glycosylase II
MDRTFALEPRGRFSLPASIRFLEGFTPAAYQTREAGHLHFAFPIEKSWETAGVCVQQSGRIVEGKFFGEADVAEVIPQVERILSLDIDASQFDEVGKRDPVVGRLQEAHKGLRPVLFWSPYEAAAWAIIGQRVRMSHAARVKQKIAAQLGETIDVHGEQTQSFPSPRRLLELSDFPGLSGSKVERLRSLAQRVLEGQLDAPTLRSLPTDDAMQVLQQLPGIGPFSAELILVRGAGEPDYFPNHEKRLHRAMAESYGLEGQPSTQVLADIADAWRPFRSWTALLFRAGIESPSSD